MGTEDATAAHEIPYYSLNYCLRDPLAHTHNTPTTLSSTLVGRERRSRKHRAYTVTRTPYSDTHGLRWQIGTRRHTAALIRTHIHTHTAARTVTMTDDTHTTHAAHTVARTRTAITHTHNDHARTHTTIHIRPKARIVAGYRFADTLGNSGRGCGHGCGRST